MKPYDWMVKYTPQTDWIEHKGIFVWLSLYAGILGGGFYLVSLLVNNLKGMFIAWLIILVIKSGLHVIHAERPLKLWRMFLRPQTSWISRGLIFTVLCIVFGAIQLALSYWASGTAGELVFKVLVGIAAFGVIVYAGFTLSYVNGIPIWNSALLPTLNIFWGIVSGMALVMVLGVDVHTGKAIIGANLGILVAGLILVILYLWTATYAEPTARESVRELTRGSLSLVLWIGVFLFGILVPLVISLVNLFSGSATTFPVAIIMLFSEIVGGLTFTYCVLKAGTYSPLISGQT